MIKTVLKEILIILLLIITVILLLGILFYEYIPDSKTIPSKVEEYTLAEDVKQELDKELEDSESREIVKTYQIDTQDLEYYEKTKQYDKGKVNPFEQIYIESEGNTINNTNNINNNGKASTNGNNNSNSTGNFLNTTGK